MTRIFTLFLGMCMAISVVAQPTASMRVLWDGSASEAYVEAKIDSPDFMEADCAFGTADGWSSFGFWITWDTVVIDQVVPLTEDCVGDSGYAFDSEPSTENVPVLDAPDYLATLVSTGDELLGHPVAWPADTWVTICTLQLSGITPPPPSPNDGNDQNLGSPTGSPPIALGNPTYGIDDPFYFGSWSGQSDFGEIFFTNATPLPLRLTKFEANKFGDRSVMLNWVTSEEFNTSHFLIQRSEDANEWRDIGSVEAIGEFGEVYEYSFEDKNVYDGRTPNKRFYYRLQMVDIDASFTTSPIEVVSFTSQSFDISDAVIVFPNPSSRGVNVEFDLDSELVPERMEIYNALGQMLFSRDLAEGTEIEYIDYNRADIPGGTHFLRVTSTDGQIVAEQKLVVTR